MNAAKAIAGAAMAANAVEALVDDKRPTRVATTLLAVAAAGLCLQTPEAMGALQTSLMFATSSWMWTLDTLTLMPYPLGAALLTLLSPSGRAFLLRAFALGDVDAIVVGATLTLAVMTVAALCVWSRYHHHGALQDVLGPILSRPLGVVVFGFGNALVEELEFRGIILTTLDHPVGVLLQAVLFAIQHVRGGFPNGFLGGVLVFLWGAALGFLRIYANGILPGYIVHVVADLTIALLIRSRQTLLSFLEDEPTPRPPPRRRRRRRRTSSNS